MSNLLEILNTLIQYPENEVVEFKEAKTSFVTDELGEYFSAISNEANLHEQQHGWLIVLTRHCGPIWRYVDTAG